NYLENDPTNACYNLSGQRDYCGPRAFPGTVTRLFRNLGGDGKGVRFEDVTVKAGLAAAPGPGLGVYCADFTGDGWPDIFIANDNKPNHLWVNRPAPNAHPLIWAWSSPRFTAADCAVALAVAQAPIPAPGGGRVFREEAHLRGIAVNSMAQAEAGMGVAVGDVDGDGLFDVYVTHLARDRNTLWQQGPRRGSF